MMNEVFRINMEVSQNGQQAREYITFMKAHMKQDWKQAEVSVPWAFMQVVRHVSEAELSAQKEFVCMKEKLQEKRHCVGAGEMAQQLRTLAGLPEVLN